jgi:hypothetical protein
MVDELFDQHCNQRSIKAKASKQEGLFKQVLRYIELRQANSGLNAHEYDSIENPYDPATKFFEAYVRNRTLGACRAFCCYGPNKSEITIIAIKPVRKNINNWLASARQEKNAMCSWNHIVVAQ